MAVRTIKEVNEVLEGFGEALERLTARVDGHRDTLLAIMARLAALEEAKPRKLVTTGPAGDEWEKVKRWVVKKSKVLGDPIDL